MVPTPKSDNNSEMSSQHCTCGICPGCVSFLNSHGANQGTGMYSVPTTQPNMATVAGSAMPFDDSEYFDWEAVESLLADQIVDGYKPMTGGNNISPFPPGGPCVESGYASQPYEPQYNAIGQYPAPAPLYHNPVPAGHPQSVDDQTIEVPKEASFDLPHRTTLSVTMGTGLAGNAVKRSEPLKTNGKRPLRAITGHDTTEQRSTKTRKLYDASEHLPFTKEQTDLLDVKLQQWQSNSHLPVDKELKTIAAACELSPLRVALWFGAKLRLDQGPAGPRPQQPDAPQAPRSTDLSALIWKYINDANSKECTSGKSTGKYRCTWGCAYSTDSRFDWERHEESKQPQKFWACISCRGSASDHTFITHRRDKLFPHIHSMHSDEEGNKHQLRDDSEVQYDAPFIRECTFTLPSNGVTCGHHFSSWKERNDHWVNHFNGGIDDNSDQPPFLRNKDVGDGGSSGDSGSSDTSSTSKSGEHGSSQQSQNRGQSQPRQHSGGKQRSHKAASMDTPIKAESNESFQSQPLAHPPKSCQLSFIDVHEHKLVNPAVTPKFLALDCNIEAMASLPQRTYLKLNSETKLSLPARDGAVTVLKAAVELAREMGFQYLWTDMIGTCRASPESRDRIYQEAMLIASMGFRKDQAQQIWHFTSDFEHLHKVRAWSEQRNWFRHVEPLGQGAYGFVDKVELASPGLAIETYARKIVLRDRTNKSQRARYLKEIEIMQSLNHPHIARFVAAYCDRTALNILMSPVAHCDLRRFISTPQEFTAQSPYLPQWFMSLAEALKYMHNMGLRHKDIKPANILISDNKVLLTDFGTSLRLSKSSSNTPGGTFLTPKYSAPEIAAQKIRGLPADIFSLGCVFAEMIAIGLGESLEQFHDTIKLADEFSDSDTNYNQRIPQLQAWLQLLNEMKLNASLKGAISITERMVSSEQSDRPSAAEVVRALCAAGNGFSDTFCDLCSAEDRSAAKPSTGCHCCSTSLGICHNSLPREFVVINNMLSLNFSSSDLQKLALTFDVQINDNTKAADKLELFKQLLQQAFLDQRHIQLDQDVNIAEDAAKCTRPKTFRQGSSEPLRAYRKRLANAYAMSLDRLDPNKDNHDTANTIRGIVRIEEVQEGKI